MANKLNITKGDWKRKQQTNGDIHISTENWFNFIKVSFVHNSNTEEHRKQCLYNSELITDAGNTYQAANILPSELLQQRNELIELVKVSIDEIKHLKQEYKDVGHCERYLHQANKLIQKITQ